MKVIAVLPPGLEQEGAKELDELGAFAIQPLRRSVSFEADMRCLYRLNLSARLPFRFLREIARFPCESPQALYRNTQKSFNWLDWLHPSKSFRVDVSGTSNVLNHSHFNALQVKNALVDLQMDYWGKRSDINLANPDLCLHLHLNSHQAVLSLDTSSQSLHRRGYRPAMGVAPLKENLAAGLLRLSGWNFSIPLVDPLCGSGTFLIEAASMAMALPTGMSQFYLFKHWHDFDEDLWLQEQELANDNNTYKHKLPKFLGCEKNEEIAEQARINIQKAGLQEIIEIRNSHFLDLKLPNENGVLICNPPYGKRSGHQEDLATLYRELGIFCKTKASGWQLWLLSGNQNLTKYLRMKANKKIPVSNGGIDCRWLNYLIN